MASRHGAAAEQIAGSVIYIDDPQHIKENKIKADISPLELLSGATPRLLDEWQIVPQLWDTIRYEADHRSGFGHFILTGSSVPIQEEDRSIHWNCVPLYLAKRFGE